MSKAKLRRLLKDYYTNLYKDQLGLADFQWRVKQRIQEDNPNSYYSALKNINEIAGLINLQLDNKTKILVVGTGTGAEMLALVEKNCQVYGIDPDNKALEIVRLKLGSDGKRVIKAVAEDLPFKDSFFDLVYCWQVLEHVQNLGKSIKEMVRVTKKGGNIFIGCPDYRQIVEPHYKIFLPLILPKWIVKLLIKMRGRNTKYFDSLQFVTAKKIKNLLRKNKVTAMQITRPYDLKSKIRGLDKLRYWIQDNLGIEHSQYWLIKKP